MRQFCSALAIAILLCACSTDERVTTNTVLANGNCKGTIKPIDQVSLSAVAALRGTQLLPNAKGQKEEAQTEEAQTEDGMPLLIALSRGVQPSRGFELHLSDQARVVAPGSLQIPVYWTQPDPQKPHPLVNTQPCLVVSIPNSGWQRIEAVDQHGQSLGVLNPVTAIAPMSATE